MCEDVSKLSSGKRPQILSPDPQCKSLPVSPNFKDVKSLRTPIVYKILTGRKISLFMSRSQVTFGMAVVGIGVTMHDLITAFGSPREGGKQPETSLL